MAEKTVARKKARHFYVRDGLPVPVIAARLHVTERSIWNWKADDAKNGDDWDKARVSSDLAKENIEKSTQEYLELFLRYQRDVLEQVKNSDLAAPEKVAAVTSLADAYTKTVRACSITAPALNQLAIAGDVLQKLCAYVAEKHPEAAPLLLSVLEPFGAELVKHYNHG